MRVYVLLFNPGTENEGIHSLQMGDRNLILMFADEDDATRYALLLEAQDFLTPSIVGVDEREIEEFCQAADYDCQVVPAGFMPTNDAERLFLSPPERNVAETDWETEQSHDHDPELSDYETLEVENPELDALRRRLEKLL
ncbi:DUF3110 domain-containing protein [Pseudocalidococcus azoricus]|nr:Protein of unknown function (DUF3110) [Synechococcus sp. PCC 6312]